MTVTAAKWVHPDAWTGEGGWSDYQAWFDRAGGLDDGLRLVCDDHFVLRSLMRFAMVADSGDLIPGSTLKEVGVRDRLTGVQEYVFCNVLRVRTPNRRVIPKSLRIPLPTVVRGNVGYPICWWGEEPEIRVAEFVGGPLDGETGNIGERDQITVGYFHRAHYDGGMGPNVMSAHAYKMSRSGVMRYVGVKFWGAEA